MQRTLAFAAVLTLASLALASPGAPALAQAVEVAPLAAPDAFSTAGRPTGLSADLWRGASVDTLGAVLPKLGQRPLSPAAAALARRVLATGAPGPQGLGTIRRCSRRGANALVALGDPRAAAAILARAPGLDRNAELSRAAAESALVASDAARACGIAQALTVGRDDVYWLRLRAYCQASAGQAAQAQLTFDLAQAQARDETFGRLMSAKLAGGGNPGAASLRNGLDYALSRDLGLDLAAAKPAPALAAALPGTDPAEPAWTIPAGDTDRLAAARALAAGQPVAPELVARPARRGGQGAGGAARRPPGRGPDRRGLRRRERPGPARPAGGAGGSRGAGAGGAQSGARGGGPGAAGRRDRHAGAVDLRRRRRRRAGAGRPRPQRPGAARGRPRRRRAQFRGGRPVGGAMSKLGGSEAGRGPRHPFGVPLPLGGRRGVAAASNLLPLWGRGTAKRWRGLAARPQP
ncbi:hypothetical protein LJR219_001172 [Phenylobacterium sp. LjRoot219]